MVSLNPKRLLTSMAGGAFAAAMLAVCAHAATGDETAPAAQAPAPAVATADPVKDLLGDSMAQTGAPDASGLDRLQPVSVSPPASAAQQHFARNYVQPGPIDKLVTIPTDATKAQLQEAAREKLRGVSSPPEQTDIYAHLGHHESYAMPVEEKKIIDLIIDRLEGTRCKRNDNNHGPTCFGINAQSYGMNWQQISNMSRDGVYPFYHRIWVEADIASQPDNMKFTAMAYAVNLGPAYYPAIRATRGNLPLLRKLAHDRYIDIENHDIKKGLFLKAAEETWAWDVRQHKTDEIQAGHLSLAKNYMHQYSRPHFSFQEGKAKWTNAVDVPQDQSQGETPDLSQPPTSSTMPHDGGKLAGKFGLLALFSLAAYLAVRVPKYRLTRAIDAAFALRQAHIDKKYGAKYLDPDWEKKELEQARQAQAIKAARLQAKAARMKEAELRRAAAKEARREKATLKLQKEAAAATAQTAASSQQAPWLSPVVRAIADKGYDITLREGKLLAKRGGHFSLITETARETKVEMHGDIYQQSLTMLRAMAGKGKKIAYSGSSETERDAVRRAALQLVREGVLERGCKIDGLGAIDPQRPSPSSSWKINDRHFAPA